MKATTMTVKVMAHFRAEEIGGGSSAEGVPPDPAETLAVAPGVRRPSMVTWDGCLAGRPGACRYFCLASPPLAPQRWFASRRVERRRTAGSHLRPFAQPGESADYFTSGRPATLRILAI